MRPQQQNRRMRGRNNNNRKGPNPLTRSYESNGPDVKIRGSAQQIAEKYTTLARDAQSAGDRVMAENYLQHAEHYNRIIAAAQGQMPVNTQRDIDVDEDGVEQAGQSGEQPSARNDGSGPQPVIEGTPAEVALEQESMPSGDAADNPAGQANGKGGEQEEAAPPRRSRRPRRSRAKDEANGAGDTATEASANDEKPEAAAAEPGGSEPEAIAPAAQ